MLKPQDILFALKAHLWEEERDWSYERLAGAVGLSASQAHTSLKRMAEAGLFRLESRSLRTHAFTEFAAHGIPHVFPAEPGALVLGMPTAHAAPPLSDLLLAGEAYVWPTAEGVPGRAVTPLHAAVPLAARADERLYAALALLDAFRVGRARERAVARTELARLLDRPAQDARWQAERRMLAAGAP